MAFALSKSSLVTPTTFSRRGQRRSGRFCARCSALALCAQSSPADCFVQIFHSMAIAVCKMHEAGVVHKDISPKMFKVRRTPTSCLYCLFPALHLSSRCFPSGSLRCRTTSCASSWSAFTTQLFSAQAKISLRMFLIWAEPCFGSSPTTPQGKTTCQLQYPF